MAFVELKRHGVRSAAGGILVAILGIWSCPVTWAQEVDSSDDLYTVPTTTQADRLVAFVRRVEGFEPQTFAEYQQHVDQAPGVIRAACRRILELQPDESSISHRFARINLIAADTYGIANMSPEQQAQVLRQTAAGLASLDLNAQTLNVAQRLARGIRNSGNQALAAEAFRTLGQMFVDRQNTESPAEATKVAAAGQRMLGTATRLELTGQAIKIEGTTFDGATFDWSEYRGRTVLVVFWSTSCGPCDAEFPQIKDHLIKYRDRGFDVVGISLDAKRDAVTDYLEKHQFEWPTLFEDGAGWNHPLAIRYGITEMPTQILVDSDGIVQQLDARGAKLTELLAEQFGE